MEPNSVHTGLNTSRGQIRGAAVDGDDDTCISPFLSSLKALLRSCFSNKDGSLAQTCIKMELDIHFQKWQEELSRWCDDTRRNHWQLIKLVRFCEMPCFIYISFGVMDLR